MYVCIPNAMCETCALLQCTKKESETHPKTIVQNCIKTALETLMKYHTACTIPLTPYPQPKEIQIVHHMCDKEMSRLHDVFGKVRIF